MNGPGGFVFHDPLFTLCDSFDFVQESHAPLNPSAKLTEQSLSKAMMVRKYSDISVLSAEIVRSFVERIEVHAPETVPGSKTKRQTIVIRWNYIGAIEIPELYAEKHKETA